MSAVAEQAGIPSASLVCEGFIGQASTTAAGLGLPNLPLARLAGHVDTQSMDALTEDVRTQTVADVIENLLGEQSVAAVTNEPSPGDVVFNGSFEEVNRFFYENGWSDGLPLIPPTRERIDRFLQFTDSAPDADLGTVLPDNRRLTPMVVAANGVMAGCRPEYMPILEALARAMANPDYGVEHSGNTPGAETLITLNGPLIRELEFNFEQGALRDGFQANTTVGRFWRLLLLNGAGFRLHHNDKGTYGNTFRVVLAENEAVLDEIGWPALATDRGAARGQNAVTIARFTGGDVLASAYGTTAEEILPYLADGLAKQHGWELVFTAGLAVGTLCPMLILSPVLARTIARSGYSRDDVKQYLYQHARVPANAFERYIGEWTNLVPGRRTLNELVAEGRGPAVLAESDAPDRLVPIVARPEDFMLAVSGDPLRTNAYVFAHNGMLGYPVTQTIALPDNWASLRRSG
ncbi:MAG: UGSC family (seleno)protein [Pseudomonadota bacterium]